MCIISNVFIFKKKNLTFSYRVLAQHNLLFSKATCYPADKFKNLLKNNNINYMNEKVVLDQHCITSQGPCTAITFALAIIKYLSSESLSNKVSKAMLY